MPGLIKRKQLRATPKKPKPLVLTKDFDTQFPMFRPRRKSGWGSLREARAMATHLGKTVYIQQTDTQPARYNFYVSRALVERKRKPV